MICSLPTSLITILASSIRTSTAGLPFADVACPNLGAERAVREDYTGGEILHARSGFRLGRPRSAASGGTGGLSASGLIDAATRTLADKPPVPPTLLDLVAIRFR